ncbi:MAG TPA: integrase family protein [Allosphingosinicella sp.]|nr:integrase family protein [Allosphingosinicella sp.]
MGSTLTTQQLRALRPTGIRQEIRDPAGNNLFIIVQPKTGEISFAVRMMVGGQQRRKTLGNFPAVSLAEARDKARELKVGIRRGEALPGEFGPPSSAPKAPVGMSVAEAWELYWQEEASGRKSATEKLRIFNRDVKPLIGDKLLADVTRSDLATLIRNKHARAKTASNRLHSHLSRFLKWCSTHGQDLTGLDANPMASVPKMFSEAGTARRRYLERHELRWWFQSLNAAGEYARVHEILMRTLCRFSEIMNLTWGEVSTHSNGDQMLVIADPKNGEPHVVYLHPSAFKLLPNPPEGANAGDRVFRVKGSGKPVERIRHRMRALAEAEGMAVEHWQPHDYRRTGTTHLAGMLDSNDDPIVPDHVLDRLLGHKEQRVIRHYNIYSYYKEKKRALHNWSEALDEIRNN